MPGGTFTTTISNDNDYQRAINALAGQYGYKTQIPQPGYEEYKNPGQPIPMIINPVNQVQFAQSIIDDFIVNVIQTYETAQAFNTAQQTAATVAPITVNSN